MKDDETFASLVAKLNAMGETGEPAKKRQEIKVLKKAKREGKKLHSDPNINAMATLMEALGKPDVEESNPNHLKGKHKLKSVPAGEQDGTTKNPSKGKLVGEENTPIDEDLIASLKSQFRDLLEPTKVAEEEPTPEAVGEFAEPLYTLQDELGLEDNVLVDELARWMDGQDITEFVKTFRQNHDMPEAGQSKRGHWPDDEPEEGIVGAIGQGIDNLAVGGAKLAYKGAKAAAPHVKKGAKAGASMVSKGIKKGAKKLSKIGSKHTSYDTKTGKATTTLGMANG